MYIGVGEANFWGCEVFLPEIFKLARNVLWVFPTKFLHKDQRSRRPFLVWHPKKVFMCFSGTVGCHFWNQTTLAANFAQIFSDFARIFDKSKLLGVCLHPRFP